MGCLEIQGASLLSACQVNHIRDVKGGTVAPSSSSRLTGVEIK
ncbi:colicin release lysis protein [Escherichia coli]|nr:colicin release lysis protein [Escherichia coli]